MSPSEHERMRSLLKSALRPMGEQEPGVDLWPRMLGRLHQRLAPSHWLDFALGALAAAAVVVFPQVIPWMLMQC